MVSRDAVTVFGFAAADEWPSSGLHGAYLSDNGYAGTSGMRPCRRKDRDTISRLDRDVLPMTTGLRLLYRSHIDRLVIGKEKDLNCYSDLDPYLNRKRNDQVCVRENSPERPRRRLVERVSPDSASEGEGGDPAW